mmetsp:Transcript_26322/g.88202  ORF Transcript_26322/g.88202 Transcript_26322/m.88202 type:complete len:227 (-) Transcript_26322:367-1047(-)
MRSKSSMSLTMFCMRLEHETMASQHSRASLSASRRSSSRMAALLATLRSGLRRSCMTTRMRRDRDLRAASAVRSCRVCSASACSMASRSAAADSSDCCAACAVRCWRFRCALMKTSTPANTEHITSRATLRPTISYDTRSCAGARSSSTQLCARVSTTRSLATPAPTTVKVRAAKVRERIGMRAAMAARCRSTSICQRADRRTLSGDMSTAPAAQSASRPRVVTGR